MEHERNDLGKKKIELVRLVEILQDEIEQASKVPFSNKVMVNQEIITDIIGDIIQTYQRISIPPIMFWRKKIGFWKKPMPNITASRQRPKKS